MIRKIGKTLWPVSAGALLVAAAIAVPLFNQSPVRADVSEGLAQANALSEAFMHVADTGSPAVVYIQVKKAMDNRGMQFDPRGGVPEEFFRRFFGPDAPGRGGQQRGGQQRGGQQDNSPVPVGQGTGFIVSEDGYIVTNHHVVGDVDEIEVKMTDGRTFDAEVVGSDELTEIALIKIDAKNLPVLPLGDSDGLRVGEWVMAIGNPFGLQHTVTTGIVSAQGRANLGISASEGFYGDFIQTDAAINPGNSGGPLLNLNGEVVGVNTAIYSRSGGYMGIGFAIPVNMVKFVTDQLRDNGSISRGWLGVAIQNLNPELSQWFGDENQGVLIADVQPDSPAEKAGLKRDDVVVGFNGMPVAEAGSFRSRVASTVPGTSVEMKLLRGGKAITKDVKIGTLDQDEQVVTASNDNAKSRPLGLGVQNLTEDIAQQFGYEDAKGVVITEVRPRSIAAQAGLKPGQLIAEVNRKPVNNVRDFQTTVKEADEDQSILLLVRDGGFSRYVALDVN